MLHCQYSATNTLSFLFRGFTHFLPGVLFLLLVLLLPTTSLKQGQGGERGCPLGAVVIHVRKRGETENKSQKGRRPSVAENSNLTHELFTSPQHRPHPGLLDGPGLSRIGLNITILGLC